MLINASCKDSETETTHFLIDNRGIEIMKHLFEKVGKVGKFTMEFVDLLFQFLTSLIGPKGLRLVLISAFVERLILNIKIWSNSDYDVQKSLIEKLHQLLIGPQVFPFSTGEPYRGILTMLYDYYAPEEVEDPSLKKFLQGIRWQLTSLFIMYFQAHANESVIPTIVEFLLPNMDNIYSIRDLLYILMIQQQANKKDNLFTQYMKDLCKNQRKEFDLVIALHSIICNMISYKKSAKNLKSALECCEYVISYSVYILLSFNWNELFNEESSAVKIINFLMSASGKFSRTSSTQRGLIVSSINTAFGRADSFISLLNSGSERTKSSRSEEIILNFLFHRPAEEKKESYERGFLGEKTYAALLSQLLPDSSVFYLAEKDIQQKIMEMNESDFNVLRNKLIYLNLLANMRAFELTVQKKLVEDTAMFLKNRVFMFHFLRIDFVFESICGYLGRGKYLKEPVIKENLESFFILFTQCYWKKRKDYSKVIFQELSYFPQNEFLHVLNISLDQILTETLSYLTDEGIYTSIQFVYFLEDMAMRFPLLLLESGFATIVGKTVLYLSEINILYSWYPSYLPAHLSLDTSLDSEACLQREGGIVRSMLWLILSLLVRNEGQRKLMCKALNFFLFRKHKTFCKLAQMLNASVLLATKQSETNKQVGLSFLEFVLKGSVIQSKFKLILQDKSIIYKKTVEEIYKTILLKTDIFELIQFRCLFMFTQISQILIYLVYKIDSYLSLPKIVTEYEEVLKTPNTYYTLYISRLLGRILKMTFEKTSSENFRKLMVDLFKENMARPNYSIENCESPIDDMFKKQSEIFHCEPEYFTVSRLKRQSNLMPSLSRFREFVEYE